MTTSVQAAPRRRGSELRPVLLSEWTKLVSVRSTYWSLVATLIATVGLSALSCSFFVGRYAHLDAEEKARFDPTAFSLNGIFLAQLALGVLGVLVISSEYGTGMIRATLTAVPQRRMVLAAKTIVFGAAAFVTGTVGCFGAYFIGQAILSGKNLESTIAGPGVFRAVLGGGLYLTVLGLLALGIGAIFRHSAGSIAALFGLILVLPALTGVLPTSWQHSIDQYLPSNAGRQIFTIHRDAYTLSPLAGLGVFCIYAAIALGAAAVMITRRDA